MNIRTTTKEYREELGKRIKEIRTKRGFTAIDVSLKLGYSKGLFYGYEDGRAEMPIGIALAFTKLMNISLEHLFYGGADDKVLYEWIYKFEHSTSWTIHECLMTELEAKDFFEKDNLKPEYRKTGREFFI
jgi:transcriptional regulator with XRE-family HTH domain